MSRKATGIEVRHQRTCLSKQGRRCDCAPTYRAEAYSAFEDGRIRKSFGSLSEAKAWRGRCTVGAAQRDHQRRPVPAALAAAAAAGAVRNRSGDVYKPSALRGYEQALRLRVLPALGAIRLDEIRRGDIQALVDRLLVWATTRRRSATRCYRSARSSGARLFEGR
jgi:hypothetical protein